MSEVQPGYFNSHSLKGVPLLLWTPFPNNVLDSATVVVVVAGSRRGGTRSVQGGNPIIFKSILNKCHLAPLCTWDNLDFQL